jgi:hypothetical protein
MTDRTCIISPLLNITTVIHFYGRRPISAQVISVFRTPFFLSSLSFSLVEQLFLSASVLQSN